jgi:hypothetical protein
MLPLAYKKYTGEVAATDEEWRNFVSRLNQNDRRGVLPIWFIGVWDTAGTLAPGPFRFLTRKSVKFHQTELPSNVTHAYHSKSTSCTLKAFIDRRL